MPWRPPSSRRPLRHPPPIGAGGHCIVSRSILRGGRFTPQQQPSPGGGSYTHPAGEVEELAAPKTFQRDEGVYGENTSSTGGGGTEVRRLVVRKNGVRFQGESNISVTLS
ncbi:hypothetical protein CEXT_419431 [Caerostris extrusa]|uniref:Uncharacterized protein n=1 Tax=Caerostris extrusa TaxID=172846 RepID=A0AAV4N7N3_CAEEX|nr:hypothetical protein CEXT_419431 [Caerostris extrusa]